MAAGFAQGRRRTSALRRAVLAAAALGALPPPAAAACELPISFPRGARLSGAALGPQDSLIVVSESGTMLFVDLSDFTVREDEALNDKYKDSYGWFDLEGVAMTSPESTFLYLGMENRAAVLEYEWHEAHRITREFSLPGFEHSEAEGIQSLTWVPTDASTHQGYFYVGSQMTGSVFIYELPLLSNTGPEGNGKLVSIWTPVRGKKQIRGLSFSSGYVFLSYDDGNSNHVLIFQALGNGLPGDLAEQYEVDVANAEGMAVRKAGRGTWEVFFSSGAQTAVSVYTFRFVTGFELHERCAGLMPALHAGGARPHEVKGLLWPALACLATLGPAAAALHGG
mmetsp:Transcript_27459/g.85436  ORF Transcript_27459/g.85436 Transcript_27459/m.85436 type:complete len:338 (+) Transcript_27459:145-1158(+)